MPLQKHEQEFIDYLENLKAHHAHTESGGESFMLKAIRAKPKPKKPKAKKKKQSRVRGTTVHYKSGKVGLRRESEREVEVNVEEQKKERSNQGRQPEPDRGVRAGADSGFAAYEKDRIAVAREEYTQQAKSDHVPPGVARHLMLHQHDGVNLALEAFDRDERGFLLCDGAGVGKTRQALALATILAEREHDDVLIVTENERIFDTAFMRDAEAMGITANVEFIRQVPKHRTGLKAPHRKGKIYVTTYANLKNMAHAGWKHVIFDECHKLMNSDTIQSQAGARAMKKAKTITLASATPMDKGQHIHYICDAFGLDFDAVMARLDFQLERVSNRGGKEIYAWKPRDTVKKCAECITTFMDDITAKGLMVKREVRLDNVEYAGRMVTLSEKEMARYEKEYAAYEEELEAAEGYHKGITKASGLMRLRRLLEESKVDAAKTAILQELKAGRKVVLFATRVNTSEMRVAGTSEGTLEQLSTWLKEQKIPFSSVYGSNPNANDEIDRFQNGNSRVFLTTPESGGAGLDLDDQTGKHPRTLINLTPPFSAMRMLQQLGRIARLKTKSMARSIFLYTNTDIDDWNRAIIEDKLDVVKAAVAGEYKNLSLAATEYMTEDEIVREFAKGRKSSDGTVRVAASPHAGKAAPINLPKVTPKPVATMKPVNIPYHKKEVAKQLARSLAKRLGVPAGDLLTWNPELKKWFVHSRYADKFVETLNKLKKAVEDQKLGLVFVFKSKEAKTDFMKEGKSKGKRPAGVSDEDIAEGTKVEAEHTTDPEVARKIALDHLTEDKAYYRKLRKIHKD